MFYRTNEASWQKVLWVGKSSLTFKLLATTFKAKLATVSHLHHLLSIAIVPVSKEFLLSGRIFQEGFRS